MSGDARAPACHDALVHNVFGQRDAMACLLRRVLPRELLPYVDFCSLRAAPTKHTDDVLRRRRSDLHYIVDVVDGDVRVSIHILVEHQSTPAPRMPKRAFGYLDDVWDEYIHDHPEDEGTLPFAVLILLTQHPARNTPTRLSDLLAVPAGLRGLLGTPVELTMLVDDFSGSVMDDLETPLVTRALVEIARALLHAYKNPGALTEQRIAELAPLFDILLEHNRSEDVRALWVYVISAFEEDSPLRALILQSVSKKAKEVYMTREEFLLTKGRAEGRAEDLIAVLEHRAITIPATVRERVLGTHDDSLLRRWFQRAFQVATAEDLFEPLEA